MQFVGIVAVGIAAMFFISLFVTSIASFVNDFRISGPINRGYPYAEEQQAAVIESTTEQPEVLNPLYEGDDIVSILDRLSNVSRFQSLFNAVNGETFLKEEKLYTLFVPTDAAFQKFPYSVQVELNTMTTEERERFVTYHLVPQKMVATDLVKAGVATAVSRDALNFELRRTGGTVGNAQVVGIYPAENGIVYLIDGVLLPPEKGKI